MTNPNEPHYALTAVHDDPARPSPQASAPEEAKALPLSRLLSGLVRHKRLTLACGLLGTVAGAAWPLIQTQSFTSEGSFLIKRGGEEIDVRAFGEDADRNVGSDVPHLLQSTDLFRRVVAKIGTGEATQAQAIASLKDRIEILVPKRSSLVHVSLEADTAEGAQRTLDTYMQEAIAHHLDVYSDTRSVELIRESHAQAILDVERAQVQAAEFMTETGIVNFPEEVQTRRDDLSTAMRTRHELERNTRRVDNLRAPRIEDMREQMRALEARDLDLRSRLKPGDQAIENVGRSIRELRAQIEQGVQDHVAFLREDADSQVQAATQALAALTPFEGRFHTIQDDLEKSKARLEAAEHSLDRANRKQLMAKNLLSALTVLDHATEPQSSDTAGATSLLLRGLALGVPMTDQRVRSVEDIEALGAPVLATVPHLSTQQIQRHQQSRMIG